jgi:hypothetical protein
MPKLTSKPKPQEANGEAKDYTKVFGVFGVSFGHRSGGEAKADECPWCGKDKFYLNVTTSQYHCKHCETSGNLTTYLTWVHAKYLEQTTTEEYAALKRKRGGIPVQTLKRHQLAYAKDLGFWLIPFKNDKGNVVNLMRYHPDRPKGKGLPPNKLMLPGLPTALYGYDRLVDPKNKDKKVLLCEGPFDAIALEYSIRAENRPKYVIVAIPGAFKEEWTKYFKDRKVRAFYDNDKGGHDHTARAGKLLGEGGVAAELLALRWPDGTPDGYDVSDLVRDHPDESVLGWLVEHCYASVREPKLVWIRADQMEDVPEPDWVWPCRLMCRSYCSFSGQKGTLKSTIMRELVACYTTGKPMPGCDKVGLPPGPVIYITAEDGEAEARRSLILAKANLGLITFLPVRLPDGDQLNVLEHLEELRQMVRKLGVRLVVIDGQNSVVGAPNISTDMLARNKVTNQLHGFAQKEDLCLVGIRNEDAEGRPMGPQSMCDLGRCVLRAVKQGEPRATSTSSSSSCASANARSRRTCLTPSIAPTGKTAPTGSSSGGKRNPRRPRQ